MWCLQDELWCSRRVPAIGFDRGPRNALQEKRLWGGGRRQRYAAKPGRDSQCERVFGSELAPHACYWRPQPAEVTVDPLQRHRPLSQRPQAPRPRRPVPATHRRPLSRTHRTRSSVWPGAEDDGGTEAEQPAFTSGSRSGHARTMLGRQSLRLSALSLCARTKARRTPKSDAMLLLASSELDRRHLQRGRRWPGSTSFWASPARVSPSSSGGFQG